MTAVARLRTWPRRWLAAAAAARETARALAVVAEPEQPTWPPRKDQAVCCLARVDEYGRFPIGYCTPRCIRRPVAAQ